MADAERQMSYWRSLIPLEAQTSDFNPRLFKWKEFENYDLSGKPSLERLSPYRISRSKITPTEAHLGEGRSGRVVKANLDLDSRSPYGPTQVVAKQIYFREDPEDKLYKDFLHEIHLLAGLKHPSIVELIGFVDDKDEGTAWIVLPFHSNGNVREFLTSRSLEIPERICLIRDVFEGLEYLHTFNPPICHGDLKSLNILVSIFCEAIITDFGSARVIRETVNPPANGTQAVAASKDSSKADKKAVDVTDMSGQTGVTMEMSQDSSSLLLTGPAWSLRWAAPELVMDNERPSLASDVWSAGWVCWEVMTGKIPFEDARGEVAIVTRVIEGTLPLLREQAELAQVISLCSLVTECWKFRPGNRPTAGICHKEVAWLPSARPSRVPSSERKLVSAELHFQMGQVSYFQDRFEEARDRFMQASTAATAEDNPTLRIAALDGLGNAYRLLCKYPEAEDSYKEALEISSDLDDFGGQATALFGLGETSSLQDRHQDAKSLYERAEEIYTQINDQHGRAMALRGIGEVYLAQSMFPQAKENIEKSAELLASTGDRLGWANSLLQLARLHLTQASYIEAEEHCFQAKTLFTQVGTDHGRAGAGLVLGAIYRKQAKYSEAYESYQEAWEVCDRTGNEIGRANATFGMAETCRCQSKFSEAEELFNQALEALPPVGTEVLQSQVLQGLAAVKMNLNQHAEAQEMYEAAQDILIRHPRVGEASDRADGLTKLGNAHLMQMKLTEAEECYLEIDKIRTNAGLDSERAHALWVLAYIYWLQGRYSEGERMHERVHAIHESTGNAAGVASTFLGRGHIYRDQAKYAEAEKFYNDALKIYTELGDDQGVSNTWDGLRLSREKEGRSMGEEQVGTDPAFAT